MILPCRRTASVLQYPRQFLKEGNVLKELLDLYFTFFKLGAVTFGGGYAMLPILQREVVEKKHWATDEELMDYYAIGQCTPGIIAINTSTFIGYKYGKIPGAIAAGLGFLTELSPVVFVSFAAVSGILLKVWGGKKA